MPTLDLLTDNNRYCECGDEAWFLIDDTPLCVTHFNQWLEDQSPLPKEEDERQ